MHELLIPCKEEDDILPKWRGTPIADLLSYHNLKRPHRVHDKVELAVTMCMDHRKMLRIPEGFAYILRTGGGNPSRVQFEISFAVALGGVRALVLIAHDDCGMVGLNGRRDVFVQGLIREGWTHEEADAHFRTHAGYFDIPDTLQFVRTEAQRLQILYPNILVAPLFYALKEGLLYQV